MMEANNPNYKIIAAAGLGALGGVLLAAYLFNARNDGKPLSEHVASLSNLIKQLEEVKGDDLENLKEKIEGLITTIEQSYGKPEE